MLPPLPQMYRKNIIQATKCAHPLFFLLCRGEPTGTLMRDYSSDTCRPLQRALARTALKLVALSAYPRAYGTRTLSPYLRTLVRTAPKLVALSAYPRAYGSEACRSICVPSRVRLRCLPPYLRTLARTAPEASTPCSVPLYWFLRILLPLPTYGLDHLSIPIL